MQKIDRQRFLPVSAADLKARGWEACDFVLVTGDAYVDHPSFANGVISRLLQAQGFKVGILSQPDWRDPAAIRALGRPRLAFLVGAGNLDSLLSAYTAHKLPRHDDPYSPGGKSGRRPPRATVVYCNLIRAAYGKVPIVIGGIEASQRRFSHYDYWEDRVRRSILLDAHADLCVFGMGEAPLGEIATRLAAGARPGDLVDIRGTAYVKKDVAYLQTPAFVERFGAPVETLAHEALLPAKGAAPQRVQELADASREVPEYRRSYARAFKLIHDEQDAVRGRPVLQRCGALYVVQMPPALPLATADLDRIYDLPYTRRYHPDYEAQGGVPAWLTTEHSIVTHRGCMASCSFCAIAMHQGRVIQSRSVESIVREAEAIAAAPGFKGYLSDVAGPSANMYASHCEVQRRKGSCLERDCMLPDPCAALKAELDRQVEMLARVRAVKGVKKAFIASGVRYDLLLAPAGKGGAGARYIDNLARHHTSGQLKVAPEHQSAAVLATMKKPAYAKYEAFKEQFAAASAAAGKEQYLVAYFVSSHPGCTMQDQVALALRFKREHWSPEQVQDFIPTPMTAATAMYYSGYDPDTMTPVCTATSMRDKRRQRALLQFTRPELQGRVRKALKAIGRADLIGFGNNALVPPGPESDWEDERPRRRPGAGKGHGPPRRQQGSGRPGFRRRRS
ncbi:MAG: YgiQ family radical SAM protein [Deltaproteobacteria bacterium]|nr:YgiQ family radical SAM protein [Deltaproteobacteria bacterium]